MHSNSIESAAAFFDVDGTLTSERVWKGMLEYFQLRGLRRGTHFLYVGLHYPTYIFRKLGMIYPRLLLEDLGQQIWHGTCAVTHPKNVNISGIGLLANT